MTGLSRGGKFIDENFEHCAFDGLAYPTLERLGSGIVFTLLHPSHRCQGDVTTYRSDASIDTVYAYLVGTKSE